MKRLIGDKRLMVFNKRGQHTMGLPFGMMFSIFLIVVFIVIAFIAVNHFLTIGECSGVGMFYDELQEAVDDSWNSQESLGVDFDINLPDGVKTICFANLSAGLTGDASEEYDAISIDAVYDVNTFLLPRGKTCDIPSYNLKHVAIGAMTSLKNPYCVDLTKRDVLEIKKGFYDKFVTVS
jgi:hypothetical protein